MNGASKLSEALNAHPAVLDYIISLNPGEFERLRNPLMRKVMPQRITLRRVAVMAGIKEVEIVARVNEIAGLPIDLSAPSSHHEQLPGSPADKPGWLIHAAPEEIIWVDLIPTDEVLGDPMPTVSTAINTMKHGSIVGIKHKWEPQPFYDIWYARGFDFWAEKINKDLWHVFVFRPTD
ncbi:MAG: hypothetical protein P4L53_17240 [Candidatus Obscuribacterales bacterium]|nr:hypothetical protein [Candidatus Obscuribacterales bacterium]